MAGEQRSKKTSRPTDWWWRCFNFDTVRSGRWNKEHMTWMMLLGDNVKIRILGSECQVNNVPKFIHCKSPPSTFWVRRAPIRDTCIDTNVCVADLRGQHVPTFAMTASQSLLFGWPHHIHTPNIKSGSGSLKMWIKPNRMQFQDQRRRQHVRGMSTTV